MGFSSIYNTICNHLHYTQTKINAAGTSLGKGILSLAEVGSKDLNGIYDMESGFEKWTKLALSTLKLSDHYSASGYFKTWIGDLDKHKEIIYGSKVFLTFPKLFISKKIDEKTKETIYGLKMPPKTDKKSIDWGLFLYGIGDITCFGKLIQKSGIYSFPWLSHQAAKIGSWKIFGVEYKDVPVFNALLDKPKDFCMFVAAFIATWDCLQKTKLNQEGKRVLNPWNFEILVKLTGNIGKMVLISCSVAMKNARLGTAIYWIDLATCSASVVSDILKKRKTTRAV